MNKLIQITISNIFTIIFVWLDSESIIQMGPIFIYRKIEVHVDTFHRKKNKTEHRNTCITMNNTYYSTYIIL